MPLSEGEIRLLHLLPSSLPDEPFEGAIEHVFLHEGHKFEALSYTWGHGDKTGVLRVHHKEKGAVSGIGNASLHLTANLSVALSRLRHPDTVRTIWIDQICINQADPDEKSIQVPLISRVYETAERVIVWLGEEDEDTALAFQDLEITPIELQQVRDRVLSLHAGRQLAESEEQRMIAAHWPIVKIATGAWAASASLFKREFFQRVWVIQEVVLGREVIVKCGSHSASWDNLATVSTLHQHIHHALEKAPDTISIISSARRDYQGQGRGMDLAQAMFNSHFYKATDQRDKIYGTLGLLDISTISDLPISYTSTVEDVYRETVLLFIQHSSSLDILSSIVGPGGAGLPSWVPDCRIESHVRHRITPSIRSPRFQSSLMGPSGFGISRDRNQLFVTGLVLAQVDVVGDVHTQAGETGPTWTTMRKAEAAWMKMAHQAAQVRKTPGFPLNYHRLICASDDVAVPGSANCERDMEAFDVWSWWLNRNSDEELPYAGKHGIADVFSELSTRIVMGCAGRRILLTPEKLLALGPQTAEVGDAICWLHGCSVPLVLRMVQKELQVGDVFWEVVGACYLQGFMSGPLEYDSTEVRRFVLV